MEFMNALSKDCFDYIISDTSFVPNIKYVFGIESSVVSMSGDECKVYGFIGNGCGITWLNIDRRSKKAIELDAVKYEVIANLHEYLINTFTDGQKEYYMKFGCPVMAVLQQDQEIQKEIYSRIVKYAKEVMGIKNISYTSVLD